MRKAIIVIVIVAALAVGGYFIFQRVQQNRQNAASNFQTATMERGNLTATVGATGTVSANQTSLLTWSLTGKVGEVKAAVGDTVQVDQELANLDTTSLPQTVILARADLVAAKRNLEQLLNSDVARAQAYQAVVMAQKEVEDAETARQSKDYSRASAITVDEARANLVVAESEVDKREEAYDMVDHLPEDDPIRANAFQMYTAAVKNRDRLLANLNWLLGRPDDLEISEADARVEVAKANLDDAMREWNRLKDGPDPDDIAAAQARIDALESTLSQVSMKAPFGGTITDVAVKSGDQVAMGATAFRIDDLSRLLVEVQITEVDINNIQVGQVVTMTFDAIPEKQYTGKVIEVANVGVATQGVVNFLVTIELIDGDGAVRPGMTAAVNIETKTVTDVLLVPNRAVRLRDGQRVVFVLREGNPVPEQVEIELGLTSDLQSEVIGGDVKEGDVLVLNPPAQVFQPGGGPPPGMGGN